eukprot:scaffold69523_cov51-Attheya_sp.AAC.2
MGVITGIEARALQGPPKLGEMRQDADRELQWGGPEQIHQTYLALFMSTTQASDRVTVESLVEWPPTPIPAYPSLNFCDVIDLGAKCTSARYAHQHQSKNIIPAAENKERKETYLRVVDNQANRPLCVWVPGNFTCVPLGHNERAAIDVLIEYEYDCPLFPPPGYKPSDFLPNWMGVLWKNGTDGRFGKLSLLDLSLPGTHDSMTYDLSLTVSEEGLDNFYRISEALHFWSKWSGKSPDLSSGEIEDFLRLQAQTQKLSITAQLDNGIRFIDFRIMFEQDKKVSVC